MVTLKNCVGPEVAPLLGPGDPEPVFVQSRGAGAPFLLVCDHAGRTIPSSLGKLGLDGHALDRHIAWDIGAGSLTLRLAESLGACAVLQPYSRLVTDCNRDPTRPDAMPEVSDGTAIPGNADLTPEQRQARIEAIHTPYHAEIAELLDGFADPPLLVLVHSFTPKMGGIARPWQVGVLHRGGAVSLRLLELLRAEPGLVVGDNQPYAMDEVDYTAPRHADARGLDFLELEIRQDLLADAAGQATVAALLSRLLPQVARS